MRAIPSSALARSNAASSIGSREPRSSDDLAAQRAKPTEPLGPITRDEALEHARGILECGAYECGYFSDEAELIEEFIRADERERVAKAIEASGALACEVYAALVRGLK